jgi:hypothetical protein
VPVRSPDLVVAGDAASSSAARLADVAGWLTRVSDQPSRRRLCWSFGRLAVGAPAAARSRLVGDEPPPTVTSGTTSLLAGLAEWLTAQDGQPARE